MNEDENPNNVRATAILPLWVGSWGSFHEGKRPHPNPIHLFQFIVVVVI